MWVSILFSVTFVIAVFSFRPCYIHGLVQERRNSSALAMELRLSCSNPLICNNTNCNHFAAIPSYGTILMVVLQKGPLSSMSGDMAIYHDSSGLNSPVSTLMRRGLMLYINAGSLTQGSQWPTLLRTFNTLRPSDAYMRRWTGSSLVQIMACRLFGTKPLSEPMLEYC